MVNFYIHHIQVHSQDPLILKKKLLSLKGDVAFFDGDRIVCENQLLAALKRTQDARLNGNMITNTWGLELLLQIACTHQISEAIKLLDITSGTKIIIILSEHKNLDIQGTTLGIPKIDPSEDIYSFYNINKLNPCREVIAKGVLMSTNQYKN